MIGWHIDPVYLFHHLLVIVFGLILIRMGLSPKISLLFLTLTVLVITLVIHKFITMKRELAKLKRELTACQSLAKQNSNDI